MSPDLAQPVISTDPRYRLPAGYLEYEAGPAYFVDDGETGIVFQPDVYPVVQALAELGGVTRIVDLGCGRADKLATIHAAHPEWDLIGVDHGPNIEWLRANRDEWGVWLEANLDNQGDLLRLARAPGDAAVVVMADVLEHLRHPEYVLMLLRVWAPRAIVISSPDRIRTYGSGNLGPPPNLCHVREWSLPELCEWLECEGLVIDSRTWTRSHDQAQPLAGDKDTSLIIATVA